MKKILCHGKVLCLVHIINKLHFYMVGMKEVMVAKSDSMKLEACNTIYEAMDMKNMKN